MLKRLKRTNKWKLYLYYDGIHIKTLTINENEAPAKNTYAITVWFKKQLFKNVKVGLVVRPTVILKNDEKNKKTYWGVILEHGTPITTDI